MSNEEKAPDCVCPKCGGETLCGYGLMGGGIGVYYVCTVEGCDYFQKTQDPPEEDGEAPQ